MPQSVDTARVLLEDFWDYNIPISLEEYAKKLGLQVIESDAIGIKSGYLDAENKTICINAKDCSERKRFTIAHELGHFCLGHGSSLRDTSKADWYVVNTEHEREANLFAAELLMPAIAIKAMMEKAR